MIKPEYLVCYFPYTSDVRAIYKVVGETEKYWRIRYDSTTTDLINKKTLYARGSDIKYHVWTKEEVNQWVKRNHLIDTLRHTDLQKLTIGQLEAMVNIVKN